jgi:hypothetical protein
LETRIAEAEVRKTELEKRMHDNASNYVLIQELDAGLQMLNANLERDLERWAELAEFRQ